MECESSILAYHQHFLLEKSGGGGFLYSDQPRLARGSPRRLCRNRVEVTETMYTWSEGKIANTEHGSFGRIWSKDFRK